MKKVYNHPYNMVYVQCLESANRNEFDIKKENISTGKIEFKVGWSLVSFGEKFIITIIEEEPKKTSVTVTSAASVSLQIIDWGKNSDNIKEFYQTLNEILK